ncbi:MAG: Crp/Fnr family transcriptional regulator [Pseudomonadota bacterium]
MASEFETLPSDCTATERPRACTLCDVRERSICSDLNPRELDHIEQTMARRRVVKEHAIMREGEPNDHLFIIVQGSFRLSKLLEDGRRQVTGFLFKGDFAGVRSTDSSPYTAEALEDGLICYFPHRFLDEASAESPGLKDRLIARGQTDYHLAQDHIVLLGKQTAEERVESFFKLMAKSVGKEDDEGHINIPLPMSRQDIADYLGLRLETLSRTLGLLKKRGVLIDAARRSAILAR